MRKARRARRAASPPRKIRDKKPKRRATPATPPSPRFVGRSGSPVLDKYPPKDPSLSVRGPPVPAATKSPAPSTPAAGSATPRPAASAVPSTAVSSSAPPTSGASPPSGAPSAKPLLALEKPFDADEFAQLLGETNIRVTVPREDLAEVLRRVCDFMGFGIYVYSIQVRPARSEMLKEFVVELTRVDYSATKGEWGPFQEQGRSESPFGPGGRR